MVIDRQPVRLLMMRVTTELTETATAVQSLPSLLYAAIRCCCCCSFFRHRQLGCSFSCLSLPALPLPSWCWARCSSSDSREAVPGLRSGQVLTAANKNSLGPQRSTARVVANPGISFLPPCHPSRHHPACYQGTYLPAQVRILPVDQAGAARLHYPIRAVTNLLCLRSSSIRNLDRHPQSVSIYTRARGGG